MPPKALKLVAEYAKSNRSKCKGCSKPIVGKALRIGSVTRDERGFDVTKWHHLDCFGLISKSIDSPESIQGFNSLKAAEQDSLSNLLDKPGGGKDEDLETNEEKDNQPEEHVSETNKLENHPDERTGKKRYEEVENEIQEGSVKKQKGSAGSEYADLKISFSASDIMDNYRGVILLPKWKSFQTIIFLERDDGLKDSNKIAAFDFDGCLAETSLRRIGADAWSLMFPSIPDKLLKLYNDGYKLVIFTNESNIERWKNKRHVAVESKVGRLQKFIRCVEVPMQVFVACGFDKKGCEADPFRKPKPGMWHLMEKHFNSDIQIDMNQSFYVGDAAGREMDHSDADIKFAQAIGLKFYVPEVYFKQ